MNKEVMKAMNKGNKESVVCETFKKVAYGTLRVVTLPLYGVSLVRNKVDNWNYNRLLWNDKKAEEILNYYIPRVAEWDKEEKAFYMFDNGMGWREKNIKLKDRKWWKKFARPFGGKVRKYLINDFELEGFSKEVRDCSNGWTEVVFVLND